MWLQVGGDGEEYWYGHGRRRNCSPAFLTVAEMGGEKCWEEVRFRNKTAVEEGGEQPGGGCVPLKQSREVQRRSRAMSPKPPSNSVNVQRRSFAHGGLPEADAGLKYRPIIVARAEA